MQMSVDPQELKLELCVFVWQLLAHYPNDAAFKLGQNKAKWPLRAREMMTNGSDLAKLQRC